MKELSCTKDHNRRRVTVLCLYQRANGHMEILKICFCFCVVGGGGVVGVVSLLSDGGDDKREREKEWKKKRWSYQR